MRLPVRNSPISNSFYKSSTLIVAQNLIGKGLVFTRDRTSFLIEIVEVEAYLGSSDPASHSCRGMTKRNWPMFEAPGTCYVYLSYGINHCMNVVTGAPGVGEAVLIRAGRPLAGIEQMFKNRGFGFDPSEKAARTLVNGPGKLTKALGINLTQNGVSLESKHLRLISLGKNIPASRIATTPRIGISKAVHLPYRFILKDSPYLSRPYK